MELQNDKPFNHKGIQGLSFRSSTQFVKEGDIIKSITIHDMESEITKATEIFGEIDTDL